MSGLAPRIFRIHGYSAGQERKGVDRPLPPITIAKLTAYMYMCIALLSILLLLLLLLLLMFAGWQLLHSVSLCGSESILVRWAHHCCGEGVSVERVQLPAHNMSEKHRCRCIGERA